MKNLLKFIFYWVLAGVVGVFMMYGAVHHVDSSATLTKNHVVLSCILGPFAFTIGFGAVLGVTLGELKRLN